MADERNVDVDESKAGPPTGPCICGSLTHRPMREASPNEVRFLRCPDGPVPRYVQRGVEVMARGICWAAHPDSGIHCTLEPHGADVDHCNAYTGRPWPSRIRAT
jgi:hypothetical protein